MRVSRAVKRALVLTVGLTAAVGLAVVGVQSLREDGPSPFKQAAYKDFAWLGRAIVAHHMAGREDAPTAAVSARPRAAAGKQDGGVYVRNVLLPRAVVVPMKPVVPSPVQIAFDARRVNVPDREQQDPIFKGVHLVTIAERRYDDVRLGYTDGRPRDDKYYRDNDIQATSLDVIAKVTLVGAKPIKAALGLVTIRDRRDGRVISDRNSWQFPPAYKLDTQKNQKQVLDSKTVAYKVFDFQRYNNPKSGNYDEPEFRRLLETPVGDLRFELTPYFVAYTDGTMEGEAKAALYLGHDGYPLLHVTSLPWYIGLQYPAQYPNVDETTPLHYKLFPEIKAERYGDRHYESKEALRRETMEFWSNLRAL